MDRADEAFWAGLMVGIALAIVFWFFMAETRVDAPPKFLDDAQPVGKLLYDSFPTTGRDFRVTPDNRIPVKCYKHLRRIPPTEFE